MSAICERNGSDHLRSFSPSSPLTQKQNSTSSLYQLLCYRGRSCVPMNQNYLPTFFWTPLITSHDAIGAIDIAGPGQDIGRIRQGGDLIGSEECW